MQDRHTRLSLVTDEELRALIGEDASPGQGVDIWFKYRNLFLLVVVISQLVKLLFFPDLTLSNFEVGVHGSPSFASYLAYRAGFAAVISVLYLLSYLKNWHFEKISFLYVGIAATALLMDYFNAYVYLSESPAQWVSGLLALRFIALGCLLLNALNAHRAPSAPRTLWS
jgi:hypothetical protein